MFNNAPPKKRWIAQVLAAVLLSLLGAIAAAFMMSIAPDYVVYHSEIPINIKLKYAKGKSCIAELCPAGEGDVKGRLILISAAKYGEPTEISLRRKDDYGIDNIYAGFTNMHPSLYYDPPKIVYWHGDFSINKLKLDKGSQMLLLLTTNDPKASVEQAKPTTVVSGALSIDSADLMSYLPTIVWLLLVVVFLGCLFVLIKLFIFSSDPPPVVNHQNPEDNSDLPLSP